jgi:CBS-domain-containing membrane protein
MTQNELSKINEAFDKIIERLSNYKQSAETQAKERKGSSLACGMLEARALGLQHAIEIVHAEKDLFNHKCSLDKIRKNAVRRTKRQFACRRIRVGY